MAHTHFALEDVRAIAQKHRLKGEMYPLPRHGIINDVWRIGDDVLRLPLDADFVATMYSESVAVPAVLKAGVRTPALKVFDCDLDIVPVPFSVTEWHPGQTMGSMPRAPDWGYALAEWTATLQDLGRSIAGLHSKVNEVIDPEDVLGAWWCDNPREELPDTLDPGLYQWADRLISRLEDEFEYDPLGPPPGKTFVHHDIHPWNVLVHQEVPTLIDWGNACWGDPAVDFSGFPLWALPTLVDAYRSESKIEDNGLEARALWFWLGTALGEPNSLNPANFGRHWWRLPEDGLFELRYRLMLLPAPWSSWDK